MQDTWANTHWGRHANPKVLYDGADTQFLYHNIVSMEYTDQAEGQSDEISITLTDQKGDWFGGWFPEKGHELDIFIDYYNWDKPETKSIFHCGKFIIDDITVSGPEHQMIIKGVSQPSGSAFKETKVSRTWNQITIKQVAMEMMAKYGLENLYFHGDESVIKELEQDDESDAEFLQRICERYGYSLKIYKVGFVIYKKSIYEARDVAKTFDSVMDWGGWTWNTTLAGTYTGARISYVNPKKSRKKVDKNLPSDIDIIVGTAERLLVINERADSEAEAIEVAKNKVNAENEKITTIRFDMRFDPVMIASSNIMIKGIGHPDGKYFITSVRTSLGSSGCRMSVSAYRIQERLL